MIFMPNTDTSKDSMDAIKQLEDQYLKDTLTDEEFTSEVIELVLSDESLSKTLREQAQKSGDTLENAIVKRFIQPMKTSKALNKLQEQYFSDTLTDEALTSEVIKLVLSNENLSQRLREKAQSSGDTLEHTIDKLFIQPMKTAKTACKKIEENGEEELRRAEAARKGVEEQVRRSSAFLAAHYDAQNSSCTTSPISGSAPFLQSPLMLNSNPTISSSPSSKEIRPSFMMKALAGIALLGGIAMTIVGCLLVQPWVIAVGVAVTFGGAYGLGFFDSKPKVTVQNTLDREFNLTLAQ